MCTVEESTASLIESGEQIAVTVTGTGFGGASFAFLLHPAVITASVRRRAHCGSLLRMGDSVIGGSFSLALLSPPRKNALSGDQMFIP